MNIQQAMKSGKKFRRKGWGSGFSSLEFAYSLTKADILADDWEVEEVTVSITRQQFWDAIVTVQAERESERTIYPYPYFSLDVIRWKDIHKLADKLGLGDTDEADV